MGQAGVVEGRKQVAEDQADNSRKECLKKDECLIIGKKPDNSRQAQDDW
jgi:hypothetical protein